MLIALQPIGTLSRESPQYDDAPLHATVSTASYAILVSDTPTYVIGVPFTHSVHLPRIACRASTRHRLHHICSPQLEMDPLVDCKSGTQDHHRQKVVKRTVSKQRFPLHHPLKRCLSLFEDRRTPVFIKPVPLNHYIRRPTSQCLT